MALSPDLVHRRLAEAARNLRWSRAGRFLVSGGAASLLCLILFLACDTRFHVGAVARWLGFSGVVAPLLAGIALAVPWWRRPLPELALARRIELACGGAGNALVNAIQFERELSPSTALRAAVFAELADPFPRVNWSEVFDLKLLARLGAAFGAGLAIIFCWGLLRPAAFANSVARVFLPAGRIAPLTRTRLIRLTPGDANVTHGTALEINAVFSGDVPRTAWVRFREAGGAWQQELMNREVGTPSFGYRWPAVDQPLEYYLEAGDLETPVYAVSVGTPTVVEGRRAEIQPPAYTHLPARTVSGFHTLEGVLPGSQVLFTVDFNNPLASLQVRDDQSAAYPATRLGDRRWTVAFPVRASRTLSLDFRGRDGFEGHEMLPISIQADEVPKLQITEPGPDRALQAAPTASFGLEFTATDDYGLGSVGLYRSTAEKPDAQLVQAWSGAAGHKVFSAATKVALGPYVKPGDKEITFCLLARDQNDVTGPGIARSRPLTISLETTEKIAQQVTDTVANLAQGLRDLLQLQQTNLAATAAPDAAANLPALLDRQIAVSDLAGTVAAGAEDIAPEVRGTLRGVIEQEMPAAVRALRDAQLGDAGRLETLILAKLQGAPDRVATEAQRAEVENLIAGVEALLRDQKAILAETANAAPAAAEPLSNRQDQLADRSVKVRQEVTKNAGDASLGDPAFRAGLSKIAAMFSEFKIYEEMLTAAEKLGAKAFPPAAAKEAAIAANLQKMVAVLNQWQVAQAAALADTLRQAADAMKAKLAKLAELQRDILEKSKELARKDQFSKDDQSTAAAIARTKDTMGKTVEGMLTDAVIFPDMIISNQLRAQLSSIFEDVKQDDWEAIAKKLLKPSDVPVQKEESLLAAIEATTKIPEDMEMFLPKTSNTANNLDENFDQTEIPKLDNLPLPDELTDIVGTLQKEQEDLAAKVQGAASNQVLKAVQQGGPIADGPQSGYSAQGKSGNQKPMDFEQAGRSAGGREGESNGEMVGKVADDLEGRQAKVRRTNDAMQSGNVDDPSGKAANAKATGGGKASGFSNREGMDGDAPVRTANAPREFANSALAAAQALIAEKTSRKAAQASLLYLRADKLEGVAGLMQESVTALREGRLADFQGLHQKILAQLQTAQGELATGKVLSLATPEAKAAGNPEALGGGEGDAPASYKDRVADYYRSLASGK